MAGPIQGQAAGYLLWRVPAVGTNHLWFLTAEQTPIIFRLGKRRMDAYLCA
jgi:hypothetical protein